MGKVSLASADDPFFFMQGCEKYIPQVVLIDKNGEILDTVDNNNRRSNTYGCEYLEDIRDNKLKINDDRKIVVNLGKLVDKVATVLLYIDSSDQSGDFSRARYRLLVEDTN